MQGANSWVPKAWLSSAVLLLAAWGCVDSAITNRGSGGSGNGTGGRTGANHGGGGASSVSGGASVGDAGDGVAIGEGGASGGGEQPGPGGGPVASGGGGGSGGRGSGEAGDSGCRDGLVLCAGASECTDLKVGHADGASVADCGACGSECSLDHASNSTCSAGTCSPTCETGFADCNAATANDGCEASLATASNCGTCGYACSHNGSSSQACVDNRCAPTCAPRYADCNATATLTKDDGCELYLDALDRCSNGCDGAGVACGPTQVCNDGGCIAPDGVAVLSVPFTGATQAQRFAELFPPSADLEGTTLTVRAYAPGATGGTLLIYLSDTASNSSVGVLQTDLTTLAAKWIDLTIPVATGGAFNAKSVKQVNLEVNAGPGYANPTVVFVDGIRSSNLAVNDTFSASFGNLVKSSLLVVAGSTIDWTAAVP